MGLSDILRAGIAIADNVTKDVQGDVTWEAWTSQGFKGTPTYASPVILKAIIDQTRKRRFNAEGQLVTVVASLTILEPVTPNGAAGRDEPIDPRDRITLPDGTTGPILTGPGSVWDPGQARPFLNEIQLGEA
jgi:hypothetical protein